jgi:hypothetical protein
LRRHFVGLQSALNWALAQSAEQEAISDHVAQREANAVVAGDRKASEIERGYQ